MLPQPASTLHGLPQPAVHDTGEGPAVLLLHAFPLDASQWDHQVAVLSERYRCLRPDVYGCGDSPPAPFVSLDEVADAIDDALRDRGVDRIATVGLSMGGYLAMALLRRHPERIRALVLADTRSGVDTEEARADRLAMADRVRRDGVEPIIESMTDRLLSPRSLLDAHISDPVRGRIRRCTPDGVAACQQAMAARPDSTALLASLTLPLLCICGADDAVTPPDEMQQMATRTPSARMAVIEQSGHLSNLEQPERFTALLRGFLDEVYAPATA